MTTRTARTDSPDGLPPISRLLRLAKKELLEILRDRRTIFTLVLMPLLVYPLLGMVVQKLMVKSNLPDEDSVWTVVVEDEDAYARFAKVFGAGSRIAQVLEREGNEADSESTDPVQNRNGDSKETELAIFAAEQESVVEAIRIGKYDVGIVESEDPRSGLRTFELVHNPRSQFSYDAMQYVARRLRLVNDERLRRLSGVDPSVFLYVESPVDVPPATQSALLTFIPLMLVLMTITGAVYPAIDLTAGERERGTMEILVSAPVSRLALLLAKFIAVLTVAMLTALANILAMTVTVYSLGLNELIFGAAGIPVDALAVMLCLLFVLAAFFSATLLCLTSFARSFKEAQAYLIPLMLIAFAPGLLSLTPNLKTTALISVVPLFNIVMVGRDLLAGEANGLWVAVALFSTVLYGLMALSLAARVFGADGLAAGDSSGWSALIASRNLDRTGPDPAAGLWLLAVLFPAFVVLSGLAMNYANQVDANLEQRLWANAAVTTVLFAGLPVLFCILMRLPIDASLFFQPSTIVAFFASVLVGASVWTFAYEFNVLTLSGERIAKAIESFGETKYELKSLPLSTKLICLAIVPAICEEISFRGFLLSAFSRKLPAWLAVVVTAVLFGMFHVFVRDLLLIERIVPSTAMGLLLGFVCIRTRSIFPGMLLHAIHNGLLISLAHHEDWLAQWIGFEGQKHLPVEWLLIAILPLAVGLAIIFRSRPRHSEP